MTIKEIKIELASNPEKRSRFIILLFRYAQYYTKKNNVFLRAVGALIGSFYAFYSGIILGIDLPFKTKIGKGLKIFHGFGIVVQRSIKLGDNVVLRQNTTIGQSRPQEGSPVVGNNVDICANVTIIGEIVIGDNCVIGAGSVINKSFDSNYIIVGNPARVVKKLN